MFKSDFERQELMATRVEAMSETDPRIFTARHQRAAAGLPSSEHSKIKLDPRVAAFLTGAAFAALGVISLARPTIDSAASVDVSAHPLYSPAPAAISAESALTIASCPSPTEPIKSAATPTEIVEPKLSPVTAVAENLALMERPVLAAASRTRVARTNVGEFGGYTTSRKTAWCIGNSTDGYSSSPQEIVVEWNACALDKDGNYTWVPKGADYVVISEDKSSCRVEHGTGPVQTLGCVAPKTGTEH